MKKFKIAFICAFLVFGIFYIFAIIKGAKNPYKKLYSKVDEDTTDTSTVNTDSPTDKPDDENEEKDKDNEDKQVIDKELFFLIMGIDKESAFDPNVQSSRTDTMILTKVNFDTGKITMVNLPRDSRVKINGSYDKLNHSHAYGGTDLVIKTIRDFTRLDLHYYIKVDYNIVKSFVDTLGGVEYDVPINMHYEDPTAVPPFKVHVNKGLQTLNGEQALGVLRFRDYLSDIQRIENQQSFLKVIAKQALKLKNIPKLGKFVTTMFKYIDTNLSEKQFTNAILGAPKLKPEEMETITLPGTGKLIGSLSYWVLDEEKCHEIFKTKFSDYYVGQ